VHVLVRSGDGRAGWPILAGSFVSISSLELVEKNYIPAKVRLTGLQRPWSRIG